LGLSGQLESIKVSAAVYAAKGSFSPQLTAWHAMLPFVIILWWPLF